MQSKISIYDLNGYTFLKMGLAIKIGKAIEQNERLCIYQANQDCVIQICEDRTEDYKLFKE